MDSLQFEKADFAGGGPACTVCKAAIDRTYFHLAGQVICPACAEKTQTAQQRPDHSLVMKGLFYGLGAAILCAIGYAIFTYVTNFEVALIAIGVGYVVGTAVRKGSRGLGGRRCQIAAVVLTYFAITISYVPLLIQGAREAAKKEAASKSSAMQNARAQASQATATPPKPPSFKGLLTAMVVISGIAFISPFLSIASGPTGFIGILIVFLGLQQAWKQTARDSRTLVGPYQVEEPQRG